MPLVSVVIPTFNSSAYVAETLESVLAQTFDDLEIVVTDHGSSDGTWELLERYRRLPKIRMQRIEPGAGRHGTGMQPRISLRAPS